MEFWRQIFWNGLINKPDSEVTAYLQKTRVSENGPGKLLRFLQNYFIYLILILTLVYLAIDFTKFLNISPPPYGGEGLKRTYENSSVNFHYNEMMDKMFPYVRNILAVQFLGIAVICWTCFWRQKKSFLSFPKIQNDKASAVSSFIINEQFGSSFRSLVFLQVFLGLMLIAGLIVYGELKPKYIANIIAFISLASDLVLLVFILSLSWTGFVLTRKYHIMASVIISMLLFTWFFVVLYVYALSSIYFRIDGAPSNLTMEILMTRLPSIPMVIFAVIMMKLFHRDIIEMITSGK